MEYEGYFSKLHHQVRKFMQAFGQPIGTVPAVPPDDMVRLRARLVVEETFEMLEAMFPATSWSELEKLTMDSIARADVHVNMPELADALGDLDYVSEGCRIAFGIDGGPIADAIHASNMAKVGGYKDEAGKWRKPADWKAPDILGELVKQGWKQS